MVADESNMPIKGAQVTLVKENKTTTTGNKGEFTIHEDEQSDAIAAARNPGFISINSGILSYSQNGSSPIQVKIFDAVGNQVFKQTLQGSGQVDLSSGVKAKGTYFAQVTMGSAKETIRFNASGTYTNSFDSEGRALLKEIQQGEQLQFVAEGYDTLSIPLGTLDTTVEVKLKKTAPAEEQFAFGYALGNAPRPSKGCGKTASLQQTGQNSNAKKFKMRSAGLDREFWLTLPKNYDNTKPHKILFAMACMGSSGEDFSNHAPDADHPSPYYGQQNLDKEGNYIFVSPEPNSNSFGPWRNDDKDHVFFGDMLTLLEDNYCIDTTRVFVTGFSFGAMFTNSLSWDYQDRIRAVAVYATAAYNIYLPQNKGKPIAWMAVHGKNDGTCEYGTDRGAKNLALKTILKNNGKADANGNFTDASGEKLEEIQDNIAGHLCYDFKTVDPRFPVKFCSWNGTHQWTAHDGPQYRQQYANWEQTWVPDMVHEWFEQF
jgi:poly(3-hydroxybutyrate) depolymerase